MTIGPRLSEFFPKDNRYSLISLGCGIMATEMHLPYKYIVGVDAFPNCMRYVSSMRDTIPLLFDIRNIMSIFPPKSFDACIAIDSIEHLEYSEGLNLIRDAELLARKMVIFYTPIKFSENKEAVINPGLWSTGNKYNLHKSLWDESFFEKAGYKIYKDYPSKENPEGFIAVKYF